jgi:hypothetical protein
MLGILLLLVVSSQSVDPALDKHIIPLYGNSSLGYYYANIFIGTPPQMQSVIVDTGSGILALPCSRCTSCGRGHLNPPYRLESSSSSRYVTCVSC